MPDRVEAHAGNGRRVGHPARQGEDAEHHDDLADEDPAPAGIGREQPADQRADRHRDGAGRGHEAVGPRPLGAAEVRRHQRHHGRHDQRGTEPLQHRPPDDEHRQGLGQRGGGRATPVDDAADHEGPLAPDDLPDLAARDHERRHDERVEGDGELDPRDRGPDVLGHGGDGDVHDRGVQGHEELRRRQGQQDDLPTRRRAGPVFPLSAMAALLPRMQRDWRVPRAPPPANSGRDDRHAFRADPAGPVPLHRRVGVHPGPGRDGELGAGCRRHDAAAARSDRCRRAGFRVEAGDDIPGDGSAIGERRRGPNELSPTFRHHCRSAHCLWASPRWRRPHYPVPAWPRWRARRWMVRGRAEPPAPRR